MENVCPIFFHISHWAEFLANAQENIATTKSSFGPLKGTAGGLTSLKAKMMEGKGNGINFANLRLCMCKQRHYTPNITCLPKVMWNLGISNCINKQESHCAYCLQSANAYAKIKTC